MFYSTDEGFYRKYVISESSKLRTKCPSFDYFLAVRLIGLYISFLLEYIPSQIWLKQFYQ